LRAPRIFAAHRLGREKGDAAMGRNSADKLDEARGRLSRTATMLAVRFGAAQAAQLLAGAALGILLGTYGSARSIEFLRDLADELESDDDAPSTHGHA
jgi:hypothetical protein